MLKQSFNFFQSRLIVSVQKHIFKSFPVKNETLSSTRYFTQLKFSCDFEEICNRPTFQNINFSYKKPAVLLSGILTFLGFREKELEEPELITKIKRGIFSMQRGQFDQAEAELHTALKLAQDENDEDGITYIYDILANLAFETGNHSKAKALFVDVLKRLLAKGEKQDSNKVIHISLKLAKIFQETKENNLAEEGFNFCIEELQKKIEEDEKDIDSLSLWGMSMDWYARFLLNVGKKNEAFNCFKKAYDMCVKVNGLQHEQTVVLLNDLGTVSSLMGDNETAMTYFEQARDIGSKLPEMEDISAIYINLGRLYLMKEMYNESKIACEQGLKKARSFKDEVSFLEAKECLENIENAFKNSKASSVSVG